MHKLHTPAYNQAAQKDDRHSIYMAFNASMNYLLVPQMIESCCSAESVYRTIFYLWITIAFHNAYMEK